MVSVLDEFLLNTAHREEFERSDDFQELFQIHGSLESLQRLS